MEQNLSDRIRTRAYEIWLASGAREGEAEQHWLAAEKKSLRRLVPKPYQTFPPRGREAAPWPNDHCPEKAMAVLPILSHTPESVDHAHTALKPAEPWTSSALGPQVRLLIGDMLR